jgi:hypothetical protein
VNGYALLLTAHVLLLVFWLGTDIGVFLGSFRLKDPRLAPEARLEIGRLTALLDMGPRTGVILSIPTGLALAYAGGWGRGEPALVTPPVLAVVALLSLVWLAMVWRFFALQQAAARGRELAPGEARFLRLWRRVDLWWRMVLAVAIAGATLAALLGRGLFGVSWLDWKVAAFGFIVACGIAIRLAAEDLPIALGEISRRGSTPERERRLAGALNRAYPWVLAIYFTLVVMAYLSFAKPA